MTGLNEFKIDHLGIAVKSLDRALEFYRDQLGLDVSLRETVAHEKVKVAMLPLGDPRIELLEPTEPESVIGKFLDKRGEGLHHVAIRVPDLNASVERLRASGSETAERAAHWRRRPSLRVRASLLHRRRAARAHTGMKPTIGIIGGSGLYTMPAFKAHHERAIETPWGAPLDPYMVGELSGRTVAFLARHGKGHRISPSELNFRANIYGFKALGVERILSLSAVGWLKEEHKPLDVVVPDQFVDRTRGRVSTFFGEGLVAHVELRASDLSATRYIGGGRWPPVWRQY